MFWRGVWGYLPVQAVQAAVGFGAIVAFTRLLTPEQYGHYALAFSVGSLIHTTFVTWLESSMQRFQVAELERGEVGAHLGTLYRIFLLMAGLVALVAAPAVLLLPLSPGLKLAIAAAVASFTIKGVFRLIQERKRAEGDVKGYALLELAFGLGGFGAGVALAGWGWGGAAPLAGVGFIVLFLLIWVAPGELHAAARGRFDAERARRYAAYGLPLSLSLLLGLVLATTDRFIIAGFLGEESVGAYHAGYSVGFRLLDVVFIWLGLAGAPAAVAALERGGLPALQQAARVQADFTVTVALPAVVGLALVAGPLVEILVGEAIRAEALQVTPWAALGGFFYGLSTYYFHQAFTLGRRTVLLLLAMAVPAVVNIGLNLWLVPAYGVVGAAWSTAASFGAGTLTAAILGRRAIPLPLPWGAAGRAALASGVMTLAVLALPAPGGWAELLLKACVGAAVYGLSLLALDAELRRRLPALLLAARSEGRPA